MIFLINEEIANEILDYYLSDDQIQLTDVMKKYEIKWFPAIKIVQDTSKWEAEVERMSEKLEQMIEDEDLFNKEYIAVWEK